MLAYNGTADRASCWDACITSNPKSESMILSYDSKELANFELLNPKYYQPEQPQQPEKPKEETKEEKVARLNVELEDAIKEEKFEKAVEITKEIDKLTSTET